MSASPTTTATEAVAGFKAGSFTATEMVEASLARIERYAKQMLNKEHGGDGDVLTRSRTSVKSWKRSSARYVCGLRSASRVHASTRPCAEVDSAAGENEAECV
jgi:hypothetical protein